MSLGTTSDGATLVLTGELTITTAGELKDTLLGALDAADDDEGLALDLAAVEEIDTAGLQLLLTLRRTAAESRTPFRLVDPSERVTSVLQIVGLNEGWIDDRG